MKPSQHRHRGKEFIVFDQRTERGLNGFLNDMVRSAHFWQALLYFSWFDLVRRYHGSLLGIFWPLLSYSVFVLVFFLFFNQFSVFGAKAYAFHVAVGYAAFLFIINSILEGCQVFLSNSSWLKSSSMPYTFYVLKVMLRLLFFFTIKLGVIFCVVMVVGETSISRFVWVVVAMMVYLANCFAVIWIVGLINVFLRDVEHFIQAIARMLLFATPILWTLEDSNPAMRLVSSINPLTYYIDIIRAPMIGANVEPNSWLVVAVLSALLFITAIGLASALRHSISLSLNR